jgi:hypothetical protein
MKEWLLALAVGFLLGAGLVLALTNRYEIYPLSDLVAIKIDRWTGRTWDSIAFREWREKNDQAQIEAEAEAESKTQAKKEEELKNDPVLRALLGKDR